jgi:hypothetical protein
MKSSDYQEFLVRDPAGRRRAFCACAMVLLACLSLQIGSVFAGSVLVGGFSLFYSSYLIAAMVLAFGLATAFACEPSHLVAVAGEIERAVPAANRRGPESVEGQTGSTPVWGNGQTSCASLTELRGCNMDLKHQLKIATVAREVERAD